MQIEPNQVEHIKMLINKNDKMLVYGLGEDSKMWDDLCRCYFIENNLEWYKQITKKYNLTVFLESYPLNGYFIKELTKFKFDCILVDAPSKPDNREESIYLSKIFLKKNGYLFIDDYERKEEREFCDKWLSKEFIKINEIKGSHSVLAIFKKIL